MKQTARESGIQGRIVNLSSIAQLHTYEGGIQFDKINEKASYSDKRAYGQCKLANLLHANELSHRLKGEGVNITVNFVHPGLIMTNLMRHNYSLIRMLSLPSQIVSFKVLTRPFWKNVPQLDCTFIIDREQLQPAIPSPKSKRRNWQIFRGVQ
ncbi:hypothetical protein Cgig2_034042 [Carnegiea gigantea]|uniref:Uncharacterized protein n=1 Tax=Carnegiea gigantea TaxID=171969 RepID=A0A9Q1QJR8_9CARY|nr:hypothetical protein Cgig2_034042 [Carnegiea gigantea]